MIADAMLIYRCWAIWSRSRRIIAGPCALLLANSIYGAIYMPGPISDARESKEHIFLWLTLSLNVSVTALIASRIWWMANKVRTLLGNDFARRHYSFIAMTIETGAIYSLYILIYETLCENPTQLGYQWFILDVGLSQVAIIAPMLIIVQAGLGRDVRDVETTLQLRDGSSSAVLTTVNHNV
ncbi:hypothetical protein NP233_g864 [Leucocoprinus birnbaumii]|uniref:Uncharacterized protein n=1 Tax=Leucocoprinus birnbaumii TaxID=56174 RepID=A0AAD5W376_9AGAR|nr:hypothetical protein NP233_g864 [Leucocoprinus birnbaumii]